MLTLVVGGAASGKSEFAESLAAGFPRYYLATMEPWDDEDRRRILRHREMRREKGFETVECYHRLERLALPGRGWVLLECLTNLLANELAEEDPEGLILRGVEHLLAQSREVVVVSGDVFADGEDYPLTLVCRESETGYIPQEYREKPWLHIVHASGKESLKPFYQAADLALYPIEKNDYNDFALSVKLLEYLEFGLPVVAVDCTETKRFVEGLGSGLVCRSDPADFADKVREILTDTSLYALCALNVQKAAQSGNLWTDRAKQIARDLSQKS